MWDSNRFDSFRYAFSDRSAGKKGKKKKLKNKYKDQSDSEREEVLTVLQVRGDLGSLE